MHSEAVSGHFYIYLGHVPSLGIPSLTISRVCVCTLLTRMYVSVGVAAWGSAVAGINVAALWLGREI